MKLLLIKLFFALVLSTASVLADDNPNLQKEAKFYRIYKKYNKNPTEIETWQKLLSEGNTQTYSIQSGDTLWDVSETLFGDPHFWPKIWSINNENVYNPHEIQPNQQIHFVEGTFGEPPSLTVKEGLEPSEGNVSVADENPEEVIENISDSELPEAKNKSRPLEKIPGSFPAWEPSSGKVTRYNLEIKDIDRKYVTPDLYLPYYISDSMPVFDGEVVETELVLGAASNDQIVYVKFDTPPRDQIYYVAENKGQIKDGFGRKNTGLLVQVLGEIEIREKVNNSKNIYRAKVTRVVDQIYVGGKVVSGNIPIMALSSEGSMSQVSADIIGGQYETSRMIFGSNDIVFLNVGSVDGVSVGQNLPIFKNQTRRNPSSEVLESNRLIGQLKIVMTSGNFSTAYITKAIEEVYVGDSTVNLNK